MAKLNAELRKGNITGTGKNYRGRLVNASLPIRKPGRRKAKGESFTMPKWASMSPLMYHLFVRAGLFSFDTGNEEVTAEDMALLNAES